MANASNVRRGFTLVEVLVALVLISGVALMMGAAIARLSGSAARDGQELRAVELARERVARVSGDPAYGALEARYNGTEAAATLGGFTRITTIQRVLTAGVGGAMLDYKTVDVQVTGPGVDGAVSRRIILAAP
jgi:prepilin-type N-terminal cleavage/methylation domain-containing protein